MLLDQPSSVSHLSYDEDTYSSIFLALKHPIRRRILRMVEDSPLTYTDILNELGIDTGLLNYHLEALSELVAKKEGHKYTLTKFGEAAVNLYRRIEEPRPPVARNYTNILVILLVALSCLSVYLYYDLNAKSMKVAALRREIEPYEGLQGMYVSMMEYPFDSRQPSPKGVHIVSGDSVEFGHSWIDPEFTRDRQPFTSIYAPKEGLTLQMILDSAGSIDTKVHLTVQIGRAFLNESGVRYKPALLDANFTCWESPVQREVHTNETGVYTCKLPSEGWYTISLVGPLHYWDDGRISYSPPIWEDVGDSWVKVDFIHVWLKCRLLDNGNPLLFGVHIHEW